LIDQLKKDLVRDEDRVRLPYEDTVGKITIGVGRNLSDVGLSDDEIDLLLDNDIKRVIGELDRAFPWWTDLPENARLFMANLNFNLGLPKFRKFTTTLRFIERRQFKAAAAAFRENRRYFAQVGQRAERLASLLENVR
jgi:lysozyme